MPPRHGKSLLTTVLFPSWYLGRHPGRSIISASYGQELADDFGRRVRNLVASPRHQAIFPGCRLSEDSTAAHRFGTSQGGSSFAVGRGGPITGRGADVLTIDDPLKDQEEANSETIRRQSYDWFTHVAYTRLMPGGAVVIVATRWHQDDLIGRLLQDHSSEGWELLSFPAIAETDDSFRRAGEALWPTRYSIESLEQIRRQIGRAGWASLYQQRPVAAEGAIFKREWLQFFDQRPKTSRVIQSWDCAYKRGRENDYSAVTTWGVAENGYYLLHAWRGRVEFPELKRLVASFDREWRPKAILVEDQASGQSLIQELKRGSRLPVLEIRPDSDKIARSQSVTPLFEAGKIFLPRAAGWIADFVEELSSFPAAPHDDFVDSAVQALRYLSSRPRYSLANLPLPVASGDKAPWLDSRRGLHFNGTEPNQLDIFSLRWPTDRRR